MYIVYFACQLCGPSRFMSFVDCCAVPFFMIALWAYQTFIYYSCSFWVKKKKKKKPFLITSVSNIRAALNITWTRMNRGCQSLSQFRGDELTRGVLSMELEPKVNCYAKLSDAISNKPQIYKLASCHPPSLSWCCVQQSIQKEENIRYLFRV